MGARRRCTGRPFLASTPAQQIALLLCDGRRVVSAAARAHESASCPTWSAATTRDPLGQQSSASTTISDPTRASADAGANETARRELEQGWPFGPSTKELTLLGYYTSEDRRTKELKVNPMGIYRGDIRSGSVGHSDA